MKYTISLHDQGIHSEDEFKATKQVSKRTIVQHDNEPTVVGFNSEITTLNLFESKNVVPIDRTARRKYLNHKLNEWISDETNHMAYVRNDDDEYKDNYALYLSLLNIIKREKLPITVWYGKFKVSPIKMVTDRKWFESKTNPREIDSSRELFKSGLDSLMIFRNGVDNPAKYVIRNHSKSKPMKGLHTGVTKDPLKDPNIVSMACKEKLHYECSYLRCKCSCHSTKSKE